jgi:3-oxoadipate enol-lactonase
MPPMLHVSEHSHEIARGIPHARLQVVASAGHLVTWEQPERINALLLQWLASLPPAD